MMARIEIVPAIGQFGRTSVAFSPDGRFAVSGTVAQRLAGDRERGYATAAEGLDLDFLFGTPDANA
jgi:hypothetical protein